MLQLMVNTYDKTQTRQEAKTKQHVVVLQDGQEVWDASSIKALAQHVQATVIPPVEQLLLADYPLRAPPAADAAEPNAGFKLDEVSVSLKVQPNC